MEAHMHPLARMTVRVALVVGLLQAGVLLAQEGLNRTVLNQADLSGAPGMEVISSILEVQPGATLPRHFHNGIETGRVLEGSMVQYPGKEPQMIATGAPIFILRGAYHAGFKVVGDKPLKLYIVHVIDKGKPLFDGVSAKPE
jgi:quercetin dioxygenase-like cupin family protein